MKDCSVKARFHWDSKATHKRLATHEMLPFGLIFCYPSVLGSRFWESDAEPTLSRQRAVKAGCVALFHASMADFQRDGTLQLIEECNFL